MRPAVRGGLGPETFAQPAESNHSEVELCSIGWVE
jgi:hypothetical protein